MRNPTTTARASVAARAIGMVLVVATLTTCTPTPPWRAVHVRLTDLLYAERAAIPLATADYPRGALAGDIRPVLSAAPPAGTAEVEHARVTLDVPEDAALELAYGVRVCPGEQLPPDAAVRFRVAMTTDRDTATLLDDTLRPSDGNAGGWKEATVSVPYRPRVTLIFTSTTSPTSTASILPLFAAPLVTVSTRAARPRNVILVSVDALRADHLGIYGYPRQTSPHIDRVFGTKGVVVDRVYSQSATTTGGHVAMLTGMWPATVSKSAGGRQWQSKAAVSLAEILRGHGYRPAAFTDQQLLDGRAGFSRGFDDGYYEELHAADATQGHLEHVVDRSLAWLTRHRDEPVFLFLHAGQVHDPYTPPPQYTQRFSSAPGASAAERDRDLYDAEIAYTDEHLARLVQGIDALGLADTTILVVTSDHGEEFAEHGRRRHGSNVTNEILHVPLLLRAPGVLPQGVRRDGPMALMDLVPTLLELLERDVPERMQGQALTQHLRQGTPVASYPIFSEARGDLAETYGDPAQWIPPSVAVTQWPWRLARIRTDAQKGVRYALYDLATDPAEKQDVFAQHAEHLEALRIAVDLYEFNAQSEQLALERGLSREQADSWPVVTQCGAGEG